MFTGTFRNTVKNLLRTPTFWLMLLVVIIVVLQNNIEHFADGTKYGPIDINTYNDMMHNIPVPNFMMYAMPLFAVVCTVITLNRDYGDRFFEIEKAAGGSTVGYVLGRLSALIAVCGVLFTAMTFGLLYLRVIVAGGVADMTAAQFLADSFVRLLCVDWVLCMPSIASYICITYAVGTLFKHGVPAMIVSSIYIIFYFMVYLMFRWKWQAVYQIYFRYLCPVPRALATHVVRVNTELYQMLMDMNGDTMTDVYLGFACMIGYIAIGTAVSYFRIKKRDV